MLSPQTKKYLAYVAGAFAVVSCLTGLIPVLATSVLGIHSVAELGGASIMFTALTAILAIAGLMLLGAKKDDLAKADGVLLGISAAGLVACFFAGTYIHTANPAFLAQTITSQLAIATGAAPGPLTFGEVFTGDVVIATGAAVLVALFAVLAYNLNSSAETPEHRV